MRFLNRIATVLTTLFGISIFVFIVLRVIPGDTITSSLGIETGVLTPEQIQSLREYYGIDKPLIGQYLSWITSFLSGDLGFSYSTGAPVWELTKPALLVTTQLALFGTILGVLMGVTVGMFSARKPGSARDFAGQFFGLLALAIPGFVLSTTIVTVMANRFQYFPNGYEYMTPVEDLSMNLQQMLFPSLVLGIAVAAPVMRTTRSALLETVDKDFVRTAYGKGVKPRVVRFRHILRNSLIPIVTMTGIQFGYLLGGAVIVEKIFALPGMGRQILDAINKREYATVQSSIMVFAILFVTINIVTDWVYRKVDPRIK
ncbi:MAG: ABC transporter permease [Actinobacteria bacterium]|jgi:peptide/nickel transport system permease protein|nr:ABC transporter permease [Actinomycetota bacterium]